LEKSIVELVGEPVGLSVRGSVGPLVVETVSESVGELFGDVVGLSVGDVAGELVGDSEGDIDGAFTSGFFGVVGKITGRGLLVRVAVIGCGSCRVAGYCAASVIERVVAP
jgi:hypothetical protein